MFNKSKSWMSGGVWKPKNPHSLEHLKYLYGVLGKNQTVTEQNHGLLVETLRSISEILIWGDQNDGSVFDFFLEKNMLVFFLRFMRQKNGRQICVQLLQTLNILFENISNETSVYYLLSNNHINSIIVHKFDFSDEEVMAYYISFLKTLSLKLNKHTIHFFYNEQSNDFALYTEAIKFFNHSESMVRIAVRTITLNVYRVDERSMLRYIRDKTAAPYFSNLVWFIGGHVLELNDCIQHDTDHNSRGRLADLVAEHLDHMHYLNDILSLDISALNDVLTEHLLNKLFLPLYVFSLVDVSHTFAESSPQPTIMPVVSLFLLAQVFLIVHHVPLVRQLAHIICNGNIAVSSDQHNLPAQGSGSVCGFVQPAEPLVDTLNTTCRSRYAKYNDLGEDDEDTEAEESVSDSSAAVEAVEMPASEASAGDADEIAVAMKPTLELNPNSTDEEKLLQSSALACSFCSDFDLSDRPYLSAVFTALDCTDGDYKTLFALGLLYAISHNDGVDQMLLDSVMMPSDNSPTKHHYNTALVQQLIHIISIACQPGGKVRLATFELAILLLKSLVYNSVDGHSFLQDDHLAAIEGAREEATLQMRNFYKVWEKSEEIFLDMFEDEYREMTIRPLNVEYLTMDASILLPPTGTPLTGIEFDRRLPCGEVERAKRAIRVFFLIRSLSFTLRQEMETQLPLTRADECVNVDDVLDLNNSDLIACTIVEKDSNRKDRRFLVIDVLQLILVEPDSKRLGWGVVRFVGFLQDVEVSGDKDDSRCLHVNVLRPTLIASGAAAASRPPPRPLLSARFIFDDHIRCMAARQRLVKGRLRARQRKMQMIARLLEIPTVSSADRPQSAGGHSRRTKPSPASSAIPGRSHMVQRSVEAATPSSTDVQQSVFASIDTVAAFSAAAAREQEQSHQQMPRLAELQVSSPSAGKTSAASKKKLMSMAFRVQKQRREATATAAAAAATATEISSNADTVSSSDTDTSPACCRDYDDNTSVTNDQASIDGRQPQDDDSCISEQYDADSFAPATEGGCPLHDSLAADESDEALVVRSVSATAVPPKSLTPAKTLPASLVTMAVDTEDRRHSIDVLCSPIKLVPPADPQQIHAIVAADITSTSSDETSQPDTEDTEEQ